MGGGISEVARDERSSATDILDIPSSALSRSDEAERGEAAAHSATSGAMSQNVSVYTKSRHSPRVFVVLELYIV